MIDNHKWGKAPLSAFRIILLQVFYWCVYMWIIPGLLMNVFKQLNFSVESMIINTEWLTYLISVCFSILIFYPLLKKECHLDISKMAYTLIICLSGMFLFNIVFALLINLIDGPVNSVNQSGLNSIMGYDNLKFIMMTVIFAPILEEIVFRGGIFRVLRGKIGFFIAAFVSSFLFGFMHIFSSLLMGEFSDMVYLLLYGGLGMALAYAYEYNHSIFSCIILHMVYNFIASSAIIFA